VPDDEIGEEPHQLGGLLVRSPMRQHLLQVQVVGWSLWPFCERMSSAHLGLVHPLQMQETTPR